MSRRILITGASGMVGRHLCASLRASLFCKEIYTLVRRAPSHAHEIWWDPPAGRIDLARCEGFDAVVHLAGENVGSGEGALAFTGRWTERKKRDILASRQEGTGLLARTLAALRQPPRVLVSASGVGYYGVRAEGVAEGAPRGQGFLAGVAEAWEQAAAPAAAAGVRVVNLRFGVVLAGEGSVVGKLRLPFSLGLGGPIGSGAQRMAWVALEDAGRAIQHAITECVRGRARVRACGFPPPSLFSSPFVLVPCSASPPPPLPPAACAASACPGRSMCAAPMPAPMQSSRQRWRRRCTAPPSSPCPSLWSGQCLGRWGRSCCWPARAWCPGSCWTAGLCLTCRALGRRAQLPWPEG